ncbi:MAG: ABC transporter ATP-binding protein [Lautropia sp.]
MTSIVCQGVSYAYGEAGSGTRALDDVTLTVEPGETCVLIGPSGCGKTTLLNLVAGFIRPTSGTVLVGDRPVAQPSPDRMVVFQDHALFAWMTVAQNIMHGMYSCRSMSMQQKAARTEELMQLVQLQGFADAYPSELSGGMRQRAGLARALAPKPSVLLLDEPFGALDSMTREQLQDELIQVLAQTAVTAVLVTHSMEEAVYLGDVVFILSPRPGRLARKWQRSGPPPTDRTAESFANAVRDLRTQFHAAISRPVPSKP